MTPPPGTVGTIYLIHFEEGLIVRTLPNGTIVYAQHYIGWSSKHDQRMVEHDAGRGSSLMAAIARNNINYKVVRMWEGTRTDERKLKKRREEPRFCPVCFEARENGRGLLHPGLPEIVIPSPTEGTHGEETQAAPAHL